MSFSIGLLSLTGFDVFIVRLTIIETGTDSYRLAHTRRLQQN